MNNPVIIKGNNQGIRLIINEDACMEDIVGDIKHKLLNTKNYYANIRPISITFEGKLLTQDETKIILDTLRDIGLNIEEKKYKILSLERIKDDKELNIPSEQNGLFFVGNIRKGQSLEAKKSIVIIGDVFPGARVVSDGNIIIIGQSRGTIIAGAGGNKNAFVYCI